MAEMIPTFTGPNYLGQAGATIAKFDETSAARLKAMLEARTEIMKGTMSNLDRVVHTSGVDAPDRVLTNFGLQPAFGGPEAEQLQALYKAGLQADIAATGRSGRGGGGGGGASGDPKSDEAQVGVYVTNADGTQTKVGERRIKLNGFDTFANNLPVGQSARIETTFAAPATSTGSDGGGGAQTIPAVQGEGTAVQPSLATADPHSHDVLTYQKQVLDADGAFDTMIDGGALYIKPKGGGDDEWQPMS